MPETFGQLAPEPPDIVGDYFALGALSKAFGRIANSTNKKRVAGKFANSSDIPIEGEIELEGIVKVHGFKIAHAILDILEQHQLVYGRTDNGFFYVNEEAAFLVISLLAQKMTHRLPTMRTITDVENAFLLSSACDVIDAGNPANSQAILASAVLNFHVPQEIGQIGLGDYIELRKRYEALRQEFPLYLRDLGELIKLVDIKTARDLREGIAKLVSQIDRDIKKIERSKAARAIKRWVPIGITGAVTIGGAFLASSLEARVAFATAGFGLTALRALTDGTPIAGRLEGPQSLFLKAKKDILSAHNDLLVARKIASALHSGSLM